MGLSIGGGLGPFGVRVGTRGIGMRLGPLRASSGRRRRGNSGSPGGCGTLIVAGVGLLMVYFVVAWPFLLGTWLAVHEGATNPSTTRTTVGWIFEAAYLLGLLAATVAVARRSSALQRAELREQARTERAEMLELEQRRAAEQATVAARAAAEQDAVAATVERYRQRGRSARLTSALPVGLRGRPGEALSATLHSVSCWSREHPTEELGRVS